MTKELTPDQAVEKLKRFKTRSGLSYSQLADEIGIHVQTLLKWFAGETRPSRLALPLIQDLFTKLHNNE